VVCCCRRSQDIYAYNTQWKGNKNYTHGPYYIGCVWEKYEAVHFQHLYIYILSVSVFAQLACALPVRFAHYTSAHHTMFFPPCGALKTSSLNFFYSSSSFRFYIIYTSSFLLSPRCPSTQHLPLFLSHYLCHF